MDIKQVKAWMVANVADFVDETTGEVETTELAEYACAQFSAHTDEGEIPEEFFELSFEVGDDYERRTKRMHRIGRRRSLFG